eukprot:TRINITY_DN100790_c0_g1_i1.p1 TRINITY_DN100790_c0_g1~~TRINITY_DN100790_c0_g1_i1.p1  ORF type:complete len:163 (-),score=18.92 TRINITY_DN100790_c0_g1_i1:124-612(-)
MTETPGQDEYQGTYCFATGDMFCGTVDVTGRPAGKGVLYYFQSGECDVAIFDGMLTQTGVGVRYSQDRDVAWRLYNGQLEGGSISLHQALDIMNLQETPAIRTKDTIPNSGGFDPARHKQTEAWYAYRKLAGLPWQDSPIGPSPYYPVWRTDESLQERPSYI